MVGEGWAGVGARVTGARGDREKDWGDGWRKESSPEEVPHQRRPPPDGDSPRLIVVTDVTDVTEVTD